MYVSASFEVMESLLILSVSFDSRAAAMPSNRLLRAFLSWCFIRQTIACPSSVNTLRDIVVMAVTAFIGSVSIMMLPIIIAGFSTDSSSGFVVAFSNMYGFWYNLVTAILIIAFTYFYTAITINPVQMAEDMKKNGGFIPGIKPGRKTVEFFDMIMSRITLPGSIFLAIIAVLPSIAVKAGVTPQFAQFYGGTSLLILVGVVLDTLQQIESHLLMRHYDGLMKSGRVKGRSGAVTSI